MSFSKLLNYLVITGGGYFFLSHGGLLDLVEVKTNIKKTKKEISMLDKKIKDYKKKIRQSRSKEFIERYARTKLGMVRKDEIIYEPK